MEDSKGGHSVSTFYFNLSKAQDVEENTRKFTDAQRDYPRTYKIGGELIWHELSECFYAGTSAILNKSNTLPQTINGFGGVVQSSEGYVKAHDDASKYFCGEVNTENRLCNPNGYPLSY